MSTRGRIGIVLDDGKVASIYQHWDSYPSVLGKMLLDNYKDKAKVEKLISLGDCSCVRELVEAPKGVKHSFDNPCGNVTIAYMRDRGESECEARIDDSEDSFWDSDFEEWGYIFKDGKWYFATSHNAYEEHGERIHPNVYELTDENIEKHDAD